MAAEPVQRRLAAILAADVAGYSRLMGADEEGTLAALTAHRAELIEPAIAAHRGRLVKTTGDGLLAEFASVVDAVRCAVAVQEGMAARNASVPEDRRIEFRIGVNLGDVIVQEGDVYGDGVNIAARLEGLAEPGCVVVSGTVHEHVRGKLECAFDDLGPQSVKNIADPVRAYRLRPSGGVAAGPDEDVFELPAIAVLPFENLSGDPDQEFFADGLTEDVITALSLWRSFPVIARNSTFAYKGRSPDVRGVAKELGARYVLEGSVRKGKDRVRVTAQLIDARTGHHVWADRYDRRIEDIFELQDELTRRIAAVVVPVLERAERNRLMVARPQNLGAWECVQRGMAHLYDYDREGNRRARELFERAIELDPTYSRAYSGLAFSLHRDVFFGFAEDRAASLEKARQAARRAVELDESDALAHWELGALYSFTAEWELSLEEARTAMALNPSYPNARAVAGVALVMMGRADEGIPLIEQALDRNPHDPANSIHMGFLARGHFAARRYEAAIRCAREAIARRRNNPDPYLVLAASLAHSGRQDEARRALDEVERLSPGYARIDRWAHRFAGEEDNEHLLDGLREAGLPE